MYLSINIGALIKEYKLERYFKVIFSYFYCIYPLYRLPKVPLLCIYLSSQANWFDAYIFCRDHGMQLATVTTDIDQEAISNLISAANNDQGNGFGMGMLIS